MIATLRHIRTVAAVMLTACAPIAPAEPVTAYGDSLTFGTGTTVSYPAQLAALTDRTVLNSGVAGETSTQIADRCVRDASVGPVIVWMGTNNSYRPSEILADVARCVAHLGGRVVAVLPVMTRPYEYRGRAEHALVTSTNDSLAARYGARFLDVRARLIATGDATGIGADTLPTRVRADDVHLNDLGAGIVASYVAQVLP